MTRQAIKDAPAYDPERAPDRAHEVGLYGHYERAGYWVEDERRQFELI